MYADSFADEMLPHRDSLHGIARRLGGDPDDLVQETLLRAFQARASYRRGSNARAWLHRILINVAMTEHRRTARDRRLALRVAAEPEPELEPSPEAAQPEERQVALAAALATLPIADRRVVELADFDELRYRDIARVLDCPVGTVMSRLHRARKKLRRRLA
jgi:RNA polymerase sigma-70 factor (ECF subfamily)